MLPWCASTRFPGTGKLQTADLHPCFRWNRANRLVLLNPGTRGVAAVAVYVCVNGRKAKPVADPAGNLVAVEFTAYLSSYAPKRCTQTVRIRHRGSGRLLLETQMQPAPFTGSRIKVYGDCLSAINFSWAVTCDERFLVYMTNEGQLQVVGLEWEPGTNSLRAAAIGPPSDEVVTRYAWVPTHMTVRTSAHHGKDKVCAVLAEKRGIYEYVWDAAMPTEKPKLTQRKTTATCTARVTTSLSRRWALFLILEENSQVVQLHLAPRHDWTVVSMVFTAPGVSAHACGISRSFDSASMLPYGGPAALLIEDPPNNAKIAFTVEPEKKQLRCRRVTKLGVKSADRSLDLDAKELHHSGGVCTIGSEMRFLVGSSVWNYLVPFE